MKAFYKILLLCIICSIAYGESVETDEDDSNKKKFTYRLLPDNFMDLPLDHFNLFDNRTWPMRYFKNDEFFEEGQPIFIEVGGEWTIDGTKLQKGQVYLMAKEHRGMLLETEHRYYGNSWPINAEFTLQHFQYLQIEQALEDLAYFIEHFKASDPKFAKSKVVIHGCSYPGMLVTWMRLRFPHVVDIAYASSAPLGVGLDYPEYYEVVNDVYANVSKDCIATIRDGFKEAADLLKTDEGRKTIRNALKDWKCGDVEDLNSVKLLHVMRSVLNVQNDPLQYEEISCLILGWDSNNTSAFDRLIDLVKVKAEVRGLCEEHAVSPDQALNSKSWSYQTCTEMGTFQTLDRKNSRHPFSIDSNVEESVQECVKDFGGMVTEHVLVTGIDRVTRRYGGKRPKVTKVVTVQGNNDPWKHLASLEDYSKEAPVYIVNGNHCADIVEQDDDPEDLLELRKKVRDLVGDWLAEIS